MLASDKTELREIAISAFVVALIYQLGWLLMLMLVPLQVVYFRRGLYAQIASAIGACALLILFKLLFALVFTESLVTVVLSILFFAFAAGSLLVWNALRPFLKGLLPFVCGSLLFGIANALSFFYVQANDVLIARFLEQLSAVGFELAPLSSTAASAGNGQSNLRLILQFAASSAWFGAGVMLLINHAMAVILVSRMSLPSGKIVGKLFARLDKVRLSINYLWFFIIGWGLVLITTFGTSTAVLRFFIWNVALFASLLYAIQGYSVAMRFVSTKSPGMYRMFIWMSIVCIFIPVLNILFPIALLLLGLSTHWVPWYNTE